MEISDILKYVKEFGLLPAFVIYFLIYFHKNNQKIIKTIGDQLIIYLKSAEVVKPIRKKLLKKDIQILKYHLMTYKRIQLDVLITHYINGGELKIDLVLDKMDEWMKDCKHVDEIPVNIEIKERYCQNVRSEKLPSLKEQIIETLRENNKNPKILKKLLWSQFIIYIDKVVDELETHFLLNT